MKASLRGCPGCGGAEADVLHTQRFVLPEGHPLSAGYDVVCCVQCGFVYADTVVTQADYERYYARFSKYEDPTTSTGGGKTAWDAVRLAEEAQQIAEWMPNTQAYVLDMGCANGELLYALRERGFENLCGVDPSPACVANTLRRGIEAHVGSIFQPPEGIGQFDSVILSHVLEHILELKRAVAAIHTLIRTGGCVYIETPDASRYADYVSASFQDFNTEHINHFSCVNLANLMGAAGFMLKAQGQKVIESAPNKPYAALYGVWVKADTPSPINLELDKQLVVNIKAYINKSQAIMDAIEIRLKSALADAPQVIVWGTGQLAMKLLVETSLADAPIAALVDSNPINQGKLLRGIPILSPEQIQGMPYPIVVTTLLHQQAIMEKIRQMELPNQVVLLG